MTVRHSVGQSIRRWEGVCLQGVPLNLLLIPLHQLWFMQPGHQLGVLQTHLTGFRKLTTKPRQLATHSCFSTGAEKINQDRKTSCLTEKEPSTSQIEEGSRLKHSTSCPLGQLGCCRCCWSSTTKSRSRMKMHDYLAHASCLMHYVHDRTSFKANHVHNKYWQDDYLGCQSILQIGCLTAACAAALCLGVAAACHVHKSELASLSSC